MAWKALDFGDPRQNAEWKTWKARPAIPAPWDVRLDVLGGLTHITRCHHGPTTTFMLPLVACRPARQPVLPVLNSQTPFLFIQR